ncbi:phage tail assembly protein [Vibrio injensis]|uniref:phage tail assembly protein n=1 Tax=Vibrio injensis TaxID=1307414 RepID=UPI000933995F|nr:phage tail assembly protein [Vibrio injensis]
MSKEVELEYPIKVDGKEVSTLTMRRPVVADMLAQEKSKGSDAEKEIRMFANLCEVPPDAIHSMDMADYLELQEAYQGFLSGARKTAGKAS